MADRIRILTKVSLILVLVASASDGARCQTPEAASYPVDPVAAAGMTSGLPNGVTYRQAEMMEVRTSAQGAQGEAAAALMARSADQTIEERNRESSLQNARTNKAIKEEMRNRLKFEQAASVQRKVSANDMSSWQQNGGVRVERNVPDPFITSLIAEEEQAAARAAASGEKKRFSLFGGGDDSSPNDGGGFLSSIRPPRLPFMGGGNDDAPVASTAAAPPASDTSEPVFAQSSSQRSAAPAPAPQSLKPGVVPMISGAALVDGRSPVNPGLKPSAADRTPSSSETVSFADEMPDPERKKPGLLSKFNSSRGRAIPLLWPRS